MATVQVLECAHFLCGAMVLTLGFQFGIQMLSDSKPKHFQLIVMWLSTWAAVLIVTIPVLYAICSNPASTNLFPSYFLIMKPQGPLDKINWICLVLPTRFIVGFIFLVALYCTVSVGNWMAQWSNHSSDFEKKKGIYSIFENSGVTFRGGIKYLNQVNCSAQSPRILLASE